MAYEDRTCENCGRQIGKFETIEKWQTHPVCAPCYMRLATPVSPIKALGLTSLTQAIFVLVTGVLTIPLLVGVPLAVWGILAILQILEQKKHRSKEWIE